MAALEDEEMAVQLVGQEEPDLPEAQLVRASVKIHQNLLQ